METSLILQYIIIALLVGFALFSVFKTIKKNFSIKKNSSKSKCENNCGCS